MTDDRVVIAYIIRRAVGGMKNHLLGLLKHLDKNTFDPVVLMPTDKDFEERLNKLNVPFYWLEINDTINPLQDIASIVKLRRLLKKINPDLIHIHGNKTALIGRIAAKDIGAPVIVTVHNFLKESKNRIFWIIARFVEKFFSNWSDKIICVSKALEESLVDSFGIPEGKIKHIPNSLDLESWNENADKVKARQKFGFVNGYKYVGLVGRLVGFKGHKYAIEAMPGILSHDPGVRLVIVGDGPDRDKLMALSGKLGLKDKIFFKGHVHEMREMYNAFDYFLFPSLNEPFGIAVLEAMACRLPIVAAESGGVSEILRDGDTALMVKPGDSADIAEKMTRLIGDGALAKSISENAKKEVFDKYSINTMVNKTTAVYLECVKAGSG